MLQKKKKSFSFLTSSIFFKLIFYFETWNLNSDEIWEGEPSVYSGPETQLTPCFPGVSSIDLPEWSYVAHFISCNSGYLGVIALSTFEGEPPKNRLQPLNCPMKASPKMILHFD